MVTIRHQLAMQLQCGRIYKDAEIYVLILSE